MLKDKIKKKKKTTQVYPLKQQPEP
jgi:hypothetical protein